MKLSSAALVIAATSLGLALSACGGDADAGGESKTLRIATSGTFKPITFSEGGKLTGFDVELGTKIAEKMGMKAEFTSGQLSGLLPGLNAGKFDAVMSGLIMTDQRKAAITFSQPYLQDGAVAVVKTSNNSVTDLTKLSGLTVGAIGGSGTETDVKKLGGFKELKSYPSAPEGFADVAAGRIDVWATGGIAAKDYIKTAPNGSQLKTVGELYSVRPAGVGLPKKDTELKPKVDKAIDELWADGTIEALQKKWFGYTIPRPQ